ncbi:fused MFS/spermidine synthase [Synechococcus sp. WC101]|uniref:fused MFS/spermidine synthase n=1 Tax=Synechococcus sp. WC101 TaxID=2964536 RepID=UPI0039C1F72A
MVLLVGLTLFGSAFCLFWGQLLVGKLLLPLWGGSPLVWNTCLVFFQLALLLGYLWADRLGRGLAPGWGVLLHGILLLAGLKFLPFQFGIPGQLEGVFPSLALLADLTARAGVPLLLLSGTTPLLQRALGEAKRDPYGLYVASNAGSLAGLLGYPLLLEPRLSLSGQTHLWTGSYALVAALVLLGGVGLMLNGREVTFPRGDPVEEIPPVSWRERWRWAGWAFLPAGLLVAATTLLTTDVAAVPLLWAVPLSLYLMTFILAFGGLYPNDLALGTTALLACGALGAQVLGWARPWFWVLPLHLGAFGLVSWACHSQLARSRPPSQQLTQFYLWLAVGGSLGGLFSALLAPQMFETLLEYPLLLGVSLAALAARGGRLGLSLGLGLLLPLLLLGFRPQALFRLGAAGGLALGMALLGSVGEGSRRRWVGTGMGLVLLLGQTWLPPGLQVVAEERSAFGLHRIVEYHAEDGSFRSLLHGTTLHGSQNLDPQKALEPLTYFSREGPVGQVFQRWRAQPPSSPAQVAVLGLGIGTLAAYAEPGDEWTFFELDPTVADWAGRYFPYLDWASRRAQVRVILGDARLRLQGIPDGSYDLMVIDAFSSDAVPVHLLTQEALTLYLRKLKPQGWLLFNITNRHLDLAPVLAALARALRLPAWQQAHEELTAAQRRAGLAPSHWVLMAKSPGGRQDWDPWQPLLPQAGDPLWRDDFSNLLHVIRWPQLPLLGDIQIPAPKQNPAVIAARRFGNASALFSKTAKEIFTMQI